MRRFWEKTEADPNGCIVWIGGRDRGGYGTFWLDGRTQVAHRVAYNLTRGQLPTGYALDHLCRNRACVNPWHLDPVTPAENNARSASPSAIAARRTECIHGHRFDAVNTYTDKVGKRHCRTCDRERWRARRIRGA